MDFFCPDKEENAQLNYFHILDSWASYSRSKFQTDLLKLSRCGCVYYEARLFDSSVSFIDQLQSTGSHLEPKSPLQTLESFILNYTMLNSVRNIGETVGSPRAATMEPQIPFDYALISLGAKVLSTRNTKPLVSYDIKVLGFSVYQEPDGNSFENAPLLPIIIPGRCWRFKVNTRVLNP